MKEQYKLFNPYELQWGEEISFPSSKQLEALGNRIYNRYPARSIFLVPRALLSCKKGETLNVLDPFMGSGTTAVETVISNNIPYGLEMDPFARLVASASVSVFSHKDLKTLQICFEEIFKTWKNYEPDDIPNLSGISRWFKNDDLELLLRLRNAIISLAPAKFHDILLVTFADCIKPVSLMERQSLKPYISTKYQKVTKSVSDSFKYSFDAHLAPLIAMSKLNIPNREITWLGHDATNFNSETQIDIAISSPPYINALDYTRCIKIESALCGLIDDKAVTALRRTQVGHEVRRSQEISDFVRNIFKEYYMQISLVDIKRAETCVAYFNDIYKNLNCVFHSLKHDGEYHMIIGDNVVRKVAIPTHELIMTIAENVGFNCFGFYKYAIKDHRTSIPRNNVRNKIKYEFVLMLRKP